MTSSLPPITEYAPITSGDVALLSTFLALWLAVIFVRNILLWHGILIGSSRFLRLFVLTEAVAVGMDAVFTLWLAGFLVYRYPFNLALIKFVGWVVYYLLVLVFFHTVNSYYQKIKDREENVPNI